MQKTSSQFLWLCIAQLFVVLMLLPSNLIRESVVDESNMITSYFGDSGRNSVLNNANFLFEKAMITTGIQQGIADYKEKTDRFDMGAEGPKRLYYWLRDYLVDRAISFLYLVYLFFLRLCTVWLWLIPLIFGFACAAVYDGWCMRRIAQSNYDFVSTAAQKFSIGVVKFFFWVSAAIFFMPFRLWPFAIPISLICCFVAVSGLIRNLNKRI